MTWEVLDTQSGDVLAAYGTFEEVRAELASFLDEHPARAADLAVAAVDDSGHAVEVLDARSLVTGGAGTR